MHALEICKIRAKKQKNMDKKIYALNKRVMDKSVHLPSSCVTQMVYNFRFIKHKKNIELEY